MKFLLLISFSISVFAASELVELSDKIGQTIFDQEQSLSNSQKQKIHSKLLQIQNILTNESDRSLSCVKYSHNYLGYALTDLDSNQKLSILVEQNECSRLLATQLNSLVCVRVSNLTLGYKVLSTKLNRVLGINTSIEHCSEIVIKQRNGYFCQYQSHTAFGHLMTRLIDGSTFGGRQELNTCLSQIPR
jgi:hypothetical protein